MSGQELWMCERVGDDVLLYRTGATVVYRLPGSMWSTAQVLCRDGESALSADQRDTLASHGVKLGSDRLPPTRRRVVAGAAALTGAGMVSLALPAAAMATSPENNDPESTFTYNGAGLLWANLGGDPPLNGFRVVADLSSIDDVFDPEVDPTVTLRVIRGDFDESVTIDIALDSSGIFTFLGTRFPDGPIQGILSGPAGQLSNLFTIAQAGDG